MRAKKSLGQHFLTSASALTKIIDAAALTPADLVLEIGPGTGVLTTQILSAAGSVVAIEKDHELVAHLTDTFAPAIASGALSLIEGDILAFDPSSLHTYGIHGYKLVANIPYYITGAIIEQFLSAAYQPTRMVLLIQKEVADRIVARDGKESVLSIAVKAYGTPRIIAKVPAGAFTPAPKVDSAILLVEHITRATFSDCDEATFFKVVKFMFGKKRGQLGGRLSELVGDRTRALDLLAACGLDPKLRAENLSVVQWKQLTLSVEKVIE